MSESHTTPMCLPCPFCGAKPILETTFSGKGFIAQCPDNCIGDIATHIYPTEQETVDAWNTRATPSETERSTADKCNRAMVFKSQWEAADPVALEPWYSHWVGELTSQSLHAKADIATVLAILSKRLAQ